MKDSEFRNDMFAVHKKQEGRSSWNSAKMMERWSTIRPVKDPGLLSAAAVRKEARWKPLMFSLMK